MASEAGSSPVRLPSCGTFSYFVAAARSNPLHPALCPQDPTGQQHSDEEDLFYSALPLAHSYLASKVPIDLPATLALKERRHGSCLLGCACVLPRTRLWWLVNPFHPAVRFRPGLASRYHDRPRRPSAYPSTTPSTLIDLSATPRCGSVADPTDTRRRRATPRSIHRQASRGGEHGYRRPRAAVPAAGRFRTRRSRRLLLSPPRPVEHAPVRLVPEPARVLGLVDRVGVEDRRAGRRR